MCLRGQTAAELLYSSVLFPGLLHFKYKANDFFLDLLVSSFNPVEVCQNNLSFNDEYSCSENVSELF